MADETEVKVAGFEKSTEGEDKINEPAPDHPRFKEIYAEAKQGKRDTEELTKKLEAQGLQIAASQKHNTDLQDAVDVLTSKASETDRPDPMVDPDAYETWLEAKIEAKMLKKVEAEITPADSLPAVPTSSDKVKELIRIQEGIHDDYSEVVAEVEKEFSTNEYLAIKIHGSKNPAKAAYDYGIKRREEIKAESDTNRGQGHVEGGSFPIGGSGTNLSPAQVQMARNLGVDPKKYAAQLQTINKMRGRV